MLRQPLTMERDRNGMHCVARLFVGTCESMQELKDGEVSLTVTSPPYWNAIDYDKHALDPGQFYRTRSYSIGFAEYESYLKWLTNVFREVRRVTRPGGYLAVVVGTVLYKGMHYPVPFDVVSRLVADGWLFQQDIIWHKTTAGVKRAGVFIQKPYPGYYHPNIMTEYILVFRKRGEPIYRGASRQQSDRARLEIGEVFVKDIANNVWHIAPVPPGLLKHPCPFPEEIPWRLIQLYSYPGDLVLDPFLGSGQTAKVALYLGRNAVGYDLIEEYIKYAYQRLDEPPAIRAKQLVAEFVRVDLRAPLRGLGGSRRRGRTRHGSGVPAQLKLVHMRGR